MALLSADGVSVAFGGLAAVMDVSLEVDERSIVGLIGPNGAGKTTIINALTGFVRHSGRVTLDGHDVGSLPPHKLARRGLVRTWQSQELFEDLTVLDNVRVATETTGLLDVLLDTLKSDRWSVSERVSGALEAVGLAPLASRFPGELSQGERKLVGMARALAAGPKVLLLDEPAAGLDAHESTVLAGTIRTLAATGIAVLIVEHDVDLIMGLCDVVHVLEFGRLIASGPPHEVRADQRVIVAYLGEADEAGGGG